MSIVTSNYQGDNLDVFGAEKDQLHYQMSGERFAGNCSLRVADLPLYYA